MNLIYATIKYIRLAKIVAVWFVLPLPLAAQTYLFWTDQEEGTIRRADLDGNNVVTVKSGISKPTDLVIDEVNKKIYWSASNDLEIWRMDIDGNNAEVVVSPGSLIGSGAARCFPLCSGEQPLIFLAPSLTENRKSFLFVDADERRLAPKVFRFTEGMPNPNSSQLESVLQIGKPNAMGSDLAVQTGGKRLYSDPSSQESADNTYVWTGSTVREPRYNYIWQIDLSSPDQSTGFNAQGQPWGVAFDNKRKTLYWTVRTPSSGNNIRGGIYRMIDPWLYSENYYPELIVSFKSSSDGGDEEPKGIIVDEETGKIYWAITNWASPSGKIQSASIDGSNITDIVTGLTYPTSIALYTKPPPQAYDQSVSVDEDAVIIIELPGITHEPHYNYQMISGVSNGTATISGPYVRYEPDPNFSGSDSFRFHIRDGDTYSSEATVSIAVKEVNDPPILEAIGDKFVKEGEELSISLSGNDSDGDNLEYSLSGNSSGSSLSGNIFRWTPDYSKAGKYDVTFSVSDGKGGSDFEKISIDVTDTNRPPVLETIGEQSVKTGSELQFTLLGSDLDSDNLEYSIDSNGCSACGPSDVSQILSSLIGNVFRWKPTSDQTGTYDLKFSVSDGNGGSVAEIIRIIVENSDLYTNLTAPSHLVWKDGNPTGKIVLAPIDGSGPSHEIAKSGRYHAVDAINGKLYWTDQVSNSIWKSNIDGDQAKAIVTNVSGARPFERALFGITIDPKNEKLYWVNRSDYKIQRSNLDGTELEDFIGVESNDAPSEIAIDYQRKYLYWVSAGQSCVKRVSTDSANPQAENVICGIARSPEYLTLDVVDQKAYWVSYVDVKIQRSNFDGSNLEDLIVWGQNHPWKEASSDPGKPHGLALDLVNKKMYWVSQDYGIRKSNLDGTDIEDVYKNRDGTTDIGYGGALVLTTIQKEFLPALRPTLASIGDKSVSELQALTFSLSGSGSDGGAVTYSMSGNPSGSSLSGNTFNWTPTFDQRGSYDVTFTVSDENGGSASETITINVTNQCPSIEPKFINLFPVVSSAGSAWSQDPNYLNSNSGIPKYTIRVGQDVSVEFRASDFDEDQAFFALNDPSENPLKGKSKKGMEFEWYDGVSSGKRLLNTDGTELVTDISRSSVSGRGPRGYFKWTPSPDALMGSNEIRIDVTAPPKSNSPDPAFSDANTGESQIISHGPVCGDRLSFDLQVIPNRPPVLIVPDPIKVKVGEEIDETMLMYDLENDIIFTELNNPPAGSEFQRSTLYSDYYDKTIPPDPFFRPNPKFSGAASEASLGSKAVMPYKFKWRPLEMDVGVHKLVFDTHQYISGPWDYFLHLWSTMIKNEEIKSEDYTHHETNWIIEVESIDVDPPKIFIINKTIDFDLVPLGRKNGPRKLRIQNTGDDTLEVFDLFLSKNEYSIAQKDSLPILIPGGESRYLDIFFKPTKTGMLREDLTLFTNDPEDDEVIIRLRGEGEDIGSVLVDVPTSEVQFNPADEDGLSYATVVVRNIGELDGDVVVVSDDSGVTTPEESYYVETGRSFRVPLLFDVSKATNFTGELLIESKDGQLDPIKVPWIAARKLTLIDAEPLQGAKDVSLNNQVVLYFSAPLRITGDVPDIDVRLRPQALSGSLHERIRISKSGKIVTIPVQLEKNTDYQLTVYHAVANNGGFMPAIQRQHFTTQSRSTPPGTINGNIRLSDGTVPVGSVYLANSSNEVIAESSILRNGNYLIENISAGRYSIFAKEHATQTSGSFDLNSDGEADLINVSSGATINNIDISLKSEVTTVAKTIAPTETKNISADLNASIGDQAIKELTFQPDEIFTVSVYGSGTQDLIGFSHSVAYDTTQLKLIQIDKARDGETNLLQASGGTPFFRWFQDVGSVKYSGEILAPESKTAVSNNGLLSLLKFQARESFNKQATITIKDVVLTKLSGIEKTNDVENVSVLPDSKTPDPSSTEIMVDLDERTGNQNVREIEVSIGSSHIMELFYEEDIPIRSFVARFEYDPELIEFVSDKYETDAPIQFGGPTQVSDGIIDLFSRFRNPVQNIRCASIPIRLLKSLNAPTEIRLSEVTLNYSERAEERSETSLVITLLPGDTKILGDFDRDGDVDFDDFFMFGDAFGGSITEYDEYDLTDDDKIDFSDFFVFADNFGRKDQLGKLIALAEEMLGLPKQLDLEPNYPNPFNSSTAIRYAVSLDGFVNLHVYDIGGQRVRSIINQHQKAGRYTVTWDGKNDQGHTLSTGVYLLRLESINSSKTRKIMFVK